MALTTRARPLVAISRRRWPLTSPSNGCLNNPICSRYSSGETTASTCMTGPSPSSPSLYMPCSLTITSGSNLSALSSELADAHGCIKRSAATIAETPASVTPIGPAIPLKNDGIEEGRLVALTAAKACTIIKGVPEWEKTLLSDIPSSHRRYLSHPACVRRILSHSSVQSDPDIARRYLLWLASLKFPDYNPAAVLRAAVDARASKAAVSAIRSTEYPFDSSSLEPFFLSLCQNREFEDALEAVTVTREVHGMSPSLSTWNTALASALRFGKTDIVWRLYEKMIEGGISPDVTTVECLIKAFCSEKQLSQACELLRQVSRVGLIPDIASMNSVVSGFSRKGDFTMVSEVLHLMILIGRPPDMSTYQEVIDGLCKNRMPLEAFRVFSCLKQRCYSPGVATYYTMINGLCKMGMIKDARKLYDEMILEGLQPNDSTVNCLVDGYCKAGNLMEVRKLDSAILAKSFKEDGVTCRYMITALCHKGKTGDALSVFEEMKKKNITLNASTYGTLVLGLCKEGRVTEATNVFREMLESNLQPTYASYTCLVRSLCDMGNVTEATELFDIMKSGKLKPLPLFRDCIIGGFCKAGNADQALAWLLEMLQSDLKPKKWTFNTLICCLGVENRIDDAFLVLDLMLQFGYSLSHSCCSLLVRQLCAENCSIEAERLREIMASDIVGHYIMYCHLSRG